MGESAYGDRRHLLTGYVSSAMFPALSTIWMKNCVVALLGRLADHVSPASLSATFSLAPLSSA